MELSGYPLNLYRAAPTLTTFDHAIQALKDIVNESPQQVDSKLLIQEIDILASKLIAYSAVDLSEADLDVALGATPSGDQLTTS
ncbi:MAG TPA: hypothetical protein VMR74_04765 [Gammaproteobacteria bacterium]|nr:hypothetical protein [Gammaproteobacteria bacterium]